jgi:1,4-dihydroxy-2-naphthoate octaprenyltransferase
MKILKISVVATIASIVAWWLGIPRAVWPAHPHLADFVLALVTCLILQIAWVDAKK